MIYISGPPLRPDRGPLHTRSHGSDIPSENATEIHDGFRGVDFWHAICCPQQGPRPYNYSIVYNFVYIILHYITLAYSVS